MEIETEKGEITFMDYSMNKGTLTVGEVIFDGCQEQPVDLDFSLPDYCPDIQRILKCQVCPQITMKNISADRLDVDGSAIIRLLYVDSVQNKIRCFEHSMPFSCSFQLKSVAEDAVATTRVKVEYVNCRAVSQRRLDIHGAFSLCARVVGKSNQEIVTEVEGSDIQQKKKKTKASNLIALGQQQFSISEGLEIGQGKPQIESIIRTDVAALIHDYKTIANKLILKGEAIIRVLYLSDIDESNLETMEYSVPISQILDIVGIDDNCICDVDLDVMNQEVQIRSDGADENNLLNADIKISATVIAYEEQEIELVTDAYSTQYELNLSHKQTDVERLLEVVTDTYVDKNMVELSDKNISKIIDIWNEMSSVSAKREGGQILFTGKLNICMLALDQDETPFYSERMIDFEYAHDWSNKEQDIVCKANFCLAAITYRIAGSDSVEVKTEINLTAAVYTKNSYKAITEITADEERPKARDKEAALTIYYADKGESIWDIARKYCTSVEAIKIENDLSDDVLVGREMLLIPM